MQVTRKIAAAAAVATVATLGLATVVSANMLDGASQGTDLANQVSSVSKGGDVAKGYGHGGDKVWYFVKRDGGLVGVKGNSVGPFQACDNKAALNGIGVAAVGDDVLALIGIGHNSQTITAVKTCEQDTTQSNGKWYRVSDDVVGVSGNSVGPFQACHNDLAFSGIGVAGAVDTIGAALGLGSNQAAIDSLKTCEQSTTQSNG
ncbi:hypothetical protein E1263_20195 [Kribbella antibiotica]|uniref:Secreted protein n=1 Tax=Kribbella antibiotica TaxID=190195 RepID=A0A4R4ZJL4_9ACTN|nr:hypothetical protein [Kribbella antibiotica]TDD58236.1 hypothetical protein E1263_20195 [Kribbella antibiotica]